MNYLALKYVNKKKRYTYFSYPIIVVKFDSYEKAAKSVKSSPYPPNNGALIMVDEKTKIYDNIGHRSINPCFAKDIKEYDLFKNIKKLINTLFRK